MSAHTKTAICFLGFFLIIFKHTLNLFIIIISYSIPFSMVTIQIQLNIASSIVHKLACVTIFFLEIHLIFFGFTKKVLFHNGMRERWFLSPNFKFNYKNTSNSYIPGYENHRSQPGLNVLTAYKEGILNVF